MEKQKRTIEEVASISSMDILKEEITKSLEDFGRKAIWSKIGQKDIEEIKIKLESIKDDGEFYIKSQEDFLNKRIYSLRKQEFLDVHHNVPMLKMDERMIGLVAMMAPAMLVSLFSFISENETAKALADNISGGGGASLSMAEMRQQLAEIRSNPYIISAAEAMTAVGGLVAALNPIGRIYERIAEKRKKEETHSIAEDIQKIKLRRLTP